MPWNDNANPGPWGSPPSGDDGGRKDPTTRRPAEAFVVARRLVERGMRFVQIWDYGWESLPRRLSYSGRALASAAHSAVSVQAQAVVMRNARSIEARRAQ